MLRLACLPLLALLAACSPPRATMVAELPDPVYVGDSAETYVLSGENTTVEAEVSAGPTFVIGFSKLQGRLEIVPDDPVQSRLTVDVDTGSASATPEVVADIAMGPAFMNAGAFPRAVFVSRQLEAQGDGYEMTGELTLHGVTQGLRMPVSVSITECAIEAEVAFSFDRHAFEIQTEGSLESLVSDTVAVRFVLDLDRPCSSPGGG
jgi:polyisoprenoid-binding protein YceI